MGLLLSFVVLSFVIYSILIMDRMYGRDTITVGLKAALYSCKDSRRVIPFLVSLVYLASITLIISSSYYSYLEDRASFDSIAAQYRGAVKLYKSDATLNLNKVSQSLTDFKYKGYQEELSKFIFELRNKIVKYNESIIKKRSLKNNFFFSWYIVQPDTDMKLINILE